MCSSTRGPASAPSLVTWPTSTMRRCRALGDARQLRRALAHLRHRAGRRRAAARSTASGSSRSRRPRACSARASPRMRLELDLGQHAARVPASTPEPPRAQRDLLRRLLAGDVQHLRVCATALRAPAAAASTCRCPGRRRSAPRRPRRGRRRARGRTRRCRSATRGTSRAWTSASDCDRRRGAAPAPRSDVLRPAASTRASDNVFQASQCGHWPCHFSAGRRTRCRHTASSPSPSVSGQSISMTGTRGASAHISS